MNTLSVAGVEFRADDVRVLDFACTLGLEVPEAMVLLGELGTISARLNNGQFKVTPDVIAVLVEQDTRYNSRDLALALYGCWITDGDGSPHRDCFFDLGKVIQAQQPLQWVSVKV